jgi:spore maturation protein CgeB
VNIVFLGLSITSSWGNGHATTYRALVKALSARGHQVIFLERNLPWYADNRDLPHPGYCTAAIYESIDALHREWVSQVAAADAVVVGSYVPEGRTVIDWVLEHAGGVCAFYDIDTPVTITHLEEDGCEFLRRDQVRLFDLYLSFTGGDILRRLEQEYQARCARALYCSVDPAQYRPLNVARRWNLGYLGTYSPDRQPALELRLMEPARRWASGRFVVAGPQFPEAVEWPGNVDRIVHLAPPSHPSFYRAQQFTLNVTRAPMVAAGHSPSVRLFEAAACGTPIITDEWAGLDSFFDPGREILVTHSADETLSYLRELPEAERTALAARARARVLGAHTADHRAAELESYLAEVRN